MNSSPTTTRTSNKPLFTLTGHTRCRTVFTGRWASSVLAIEGSSQPTRTPPPVPDARSGLITDGPPRRMSRECDGTMAIVSWRPLRKLTPARDEDVRRARAVGHRLRRQWLPRRAAGGGRAPGPVAQQDRRAPRPRGRRGPAAPEPAPPAPPRQRERGGPGPPRPRTPGPPRRRRPRIP